MPFGYENEDGYSTESIISSILGYRDNVVPETESDQLFRYAIDNSSTDTFIPVLPTAEQLAQLQFINALYLQMQNQLDAVPLYQFPIVDSESQEALLIPPVNSHSNSDLNGIAESNVNSDDNKPALDGDADDNTPVDSASVLSTNLPSAPKHSQPVVNSKKRTSRPKKDPASKEEIPAYKIYRDTKARPKMNDNIDWDNLNKLSKDERRKAINRRTAENSRQRLRNKMDSLVEKEIKIKAELAQIKTQKTSLVQENKQLKSLQRQLVDLMSQLPSVQLEQYPYNQSLIALSYQLQQPKSMEVSSYQTGIDRDSDLELVQETKREPNKPNINFKLGR